MREYKWKTVSLLCHSMGAGVSLLFSYLFPEMVDLMVLIDYNKNLDRTPQQVIKGTREAMMQLIISDNRNRLKTESPCYTIEEMIDRVYEGSLGNVHRESAPYLLERNIVRSGKHPNKFCFSRDNRIKSTILEHHAEHVALYATGTLKFPFLFLSSPHSVLYAKIPYFDKFIEASKKGNPKFVYEVVDSDTHYFHINEPHKVSGVIGKFLSENRKIVHKL
jgi:pimeloyl-ACP methyl ester carboxylesterase